MNLPTSLLRHHQPTATVRIACLAALVSTELILVSIWLDNASLSGGRGLVGLVHDWGAWTVRAVVAFIVFSLVFAPFSAKKGLQQFRLAEQPIVWPLLIAHLGGLLLFAGLSWFLFESHPTGASGDVTVVSWIAMSLLAVVLAALAFVPAVAWVQIIANSRAAWVYGLTAGILACLLGRYAWALWQPLSRASFGLVRAILLPFIPGLISDPGTLVIGSQTFMVAITPECSGYEGIGLVLTFSAAWLWLLRDEWRFPRALLLLPAGVIAIWVFNALRIAMLILIGHAGAPRVALGGFHSQAGWITFTMVTIGICLLARRLPGLTKIRSGELASSKSVAYNPATPYLVPFLTILAATLVSRSVTADFEWFYPLRVLTAGVALWFFRSTYQKLDWRAGWPALGVGSLVFCVWIALDHLSRGSQAAAIPTALAEGSRAARFTWLTFRVAGAVVTVPIAEELAYRGFLMRRLTSRHFESVGWRNFAWAPFLISSIAFGVLHGERWLGGTIAGLSYAFALIRRGRIGEAVAAHATTNALVAAWVLLTGNWQMWES